MQNSAEHFKITQVKTTAFHSQSNRSLKRSYHALSEFLNTVFLNIAFQIQHL